MAECETCGADVLEVWRHRDVGESMTHRTVQWICRGCHPDVHEPVDRIGPDGVAAAD